MYCMKTGIGNKKLDGTILKNPKSQISRIDPIGFDALEDNADTFLLFLNTPKDQFQPINK